ncbi:hypothetical protein BJX64DRAFT_284012 [Aspergillus heterothallicus]
MAQKPTFILAIDLGTVASGAAWALQGQDCRINLITSFAGREQYCLPKAPSTISEDGPFNHRWGYLVEPSERSFRAFKALLDPANPTTFPPAIETGDRMARIVVLAEPEATAIYVLSCLNSHGLRTGDVLTVCDAGGATVDVVSYQVTGLQPRKLAQVTRSESTGAGSGFLDGLFQARFREMFSPGSTWSDEQRRITMIYWEERLKHRYTGDFARDFDNDQYYRLGGDGACLGLKVENGSVPFLLTKEDLDDIFGRQTWWVELLVARQWDSLAAAGRSMSALVLVGGLGCSGFLHHRLRQKFPYLRIIHPPNPLSTVVCGALYRGLEAASEPSLPATRN